jgi:hypothetical protein
MYVPAAGGTPPIWPVAEFRESPGGRLLAPADQSPSQRHPAVRSAARHALLLDRPAALAFQASRASLSPRQENRYFMQNACLGPVPYTRPGKAQNLHRGMPKLPFLPSGAALTGDLHAFTVTLSRTGCHTADSPLRYKRMTGLITGN